MSLNSVPTLFSGLRSCRACRSGAFKNVVAIDGGRRAMGTVIEKSAEASTSTPAPTNYPFSNSLTHLTTPSLSPTLQSRLSTPRNGKSLIDHLNTTSIATLDPTGRLTQLFSRRNPKRILPGSILSVVSFSNPAKTTTSTFSGVLLGIRRRGVDTSFNLRNVINKTGMEMSYKIYSPMIKEIVIVKRAGGKGSKGEGGLRDPKRAKVNYLRERGDVMTAMAGVLKADRKAGASR